MTNARTRLIVLLVSTPLVVFAVVGGLLGNTAARDDSYRHLRVFEDVVSLIMSNYVEEANLDRVMQGALRGLAEGLDSDSGYLSAAEVQTLEHNQDSTGRADIGMSLTRQYYLRIVAVGDDSPAARAGLRSGDYLRAIDGKSTRTMSAWEGARALTGEPGSKVTLTVIRGSAADPHTVTVARGLPVPGKVTGRIVAPGVGYVRVGHFDQHTADQVKAQCDELTTAGAAALVIDVRNSADSPSEVSLDTARLFVASGTLARREVRGTVVETISAKTGDGAISLPVSVLVNSGTAGAAELFTAALAGNKRATVVGERTIGRVALQKLVKLPDGSGVWLSWTRYQGPDGATLHGQGLEPDVEVGEPDLEFGAEPPATDQILEKALEQLVVKKAA